MNQQFVKETMWIAWDLSCVAGFIAVYGYMVFVETTCRTPSLWSLLLTLLILLFQVNTVIFSGRVCMKISIRFVLLFSFLAIIWGPFFLTTFSSQITSEQVLKDHSHLIMENIAS